MTPQTFDVSVQDSRTIAGASVLVTLTAQVQAPALRAELEETLVLNIASRLRSVAREELVDFEQDLYSPSPRRKAQGQGIVHSIEHSDGPVIVVEIDPQREAELLAGRSAEASAPAQEPTGIDPETLRRMRPYRQAMLRVYRDFLATQRGQGLTSVAQAEAALQDAQGVRPTWPDEEPTRRPDRSEGGVWPVRNPAVQEGELKATEQVAAAAQDTQLATPASAPALAEAVVEVMYIDPTLPPSIRIAGSLDAVLVLMTKALGARPHDKPLRTGECE